jgi:uncharacterized membrane protein
LLVYAPFALVVRPDPSGVLGAIGLSALMAATFWVTTEATRRGPVSLVAPLMAVSPVITAMLAILVLGERPALQAALAIPLAVAAAALLAYRPAAPGAISGWLGLAVLSLAMQGVGAFVAKVVVTGPGPTDLLMTGAAVQLAVGAGLARREPLALGRLVRVPGLLVAVTMIAAAIATVGYLYALSVGPASVIVPFVATSPVFGGLLGAFFLRETVTCRQLTAIALGAVAAVLLATN